MRIASNDSWTCDLIELFVLEECDVTPHYVDWLNDPSINRYLESRFAQHTLESTRAFVARCVANDAQLLLGIRYRPFSGRHVGNIKLDINPVHRIGEVGILIGDTDVHGKGVARRAIDLLAGIARNQLGLRKLTAGCYSSNLPSERAFQRAGFVIEGRRPEHFLLDNQPEALTLLGRIL